MLIVRVMDIGALDLQSLLPMFILLASLGCLAGFLAGLLGIGGGTVLVPGFFYIFGALGYDSPYLMHVAVATGLSVIIATGSSATFAHYKRGSVDRSAFMVLAPALVVGVMIGTVVSEYISSLHLQVFFAVALFLMGARMLRGAKPSEVHKRFEKSPLMFGAGGVIGVISTLMGIGGAAMNVPLMVTNGVKMQRAVGTAAALGLVVALPGAIGYMVVGSGIEANLPPFSIGFVNAIGWIAVIPFTIFCAPFGVAAAHKLNPKSLRKLFAVFMMLLALNMAAEVWL